MYTELYSETKGQRLVSVYIFFRTLNEPRRDKTSFRGLANNKGADQPAHSRSLISAYVTRFLGSTIFRLATGEISFF